MLRLGLSQLNLRLLSYAILGERIVVNGNERVVTEIRLIVYRHQSVIRHDESPIGIGGAAEVPVMRPRPSQREEAKFAWGV